MLMTYPALFLYDRTDNNVPFLVAFPNFPENFTQGENIEDAMIMAQDLLTIILNEISSNSNSFPKAFSIDEISLTANNPFGTSLQFDPQKSFVKMVEVDLDD